MGMQCLNLFYILLMTWKCTRMKEVSVKDVQSFVKKLLFGQIKVERVNMSGAIFFSKDYYLDKNEWKGQTMMCESL